MEASSSLAFAYPEEGFPFYTDCAVILRESRRMEAAHQLINYLLRARVSARIAESTKTATANAAAQALLPDAIRNNPVLYPAAADYARGEWPSTLPPAAQRLRDRLWTEI